MKVWNKRDEGVPADAVYVGRPTKWGNPFVVGRDGVRGECVELHRAWIVNQPELLAQLWQLRGKDLVCWCAPAACHAETLRDLAEADDCPF